MQQSVSHSITVTRADIVEGQLRCNSVGRIVVVILNFADIQSGTDKNLFSNLPAPTDYVYVTVSSSSGNDSRTIRLGTDGVIQWDDVPLTGIWVSASFSYIAAQ